MSRQIDLTKQLSDDERQYLEDRGMTRELDQNAAHLMGGGTSEEDADNLDEQSPYKGLKVGELKAELDKRNEGRDEDKKIVPAEPGNKPEILAALIEDDKTAE